VAVLERRLFCDCAAGIFAQPLLLLIGYAARSDLPSYTLLVPFVSAYLLYLRRDQLPKDSSTWM
jgi:hypothetical protein